MYWSSKWDGEVKFREVLMTIHSSNGHLHNTNKTFTIFRIRLLRQNSSLFPLKQNWPYHILGLFFWAGSAKYFTYYINYYLGMCNDKNMIFFPTQILKTIIYVVSSGWCYLFFFLIKNIKMCDLNWIKKSIILSVLILMGLMILIIGIMALLLLLW